MFGMLPTPDGRRLLALIQLPGYERSGDGRPLIALSAESLFGYGHLIRMTEELILDLFTKGLVSGTTHTCLGQELCQMAVVRALDQETDAVLSNHRNHGHFLTYSGEFPGLVAEIMGRADGVCGGHGGSQHLAYRHFHSNGVQAGMTAIGVGLAMQRKLAGDGGIVVTMLGDGTLGEGLLYESLNLAGIWQLPVLFVIEHNRIAQTTPTADTLAGSIPDRGAAFGLDTWRLDDAAPDLFKRAEDAVRCVRDSQKPGFLVIDTLRLGPHSKGDDLRDGAELEHIRARDPLTALGRTLRETVRESIESRNRAFMESVAEQALQSPEAKLDAARGHIFQQEHPAPPPTRLPNPPASTNVRQSLNEALKHLLETSERTILLGEDLHDPYGGAFKVTAGLSTAFPGRVISTPISEAGITGCAIGLSMAGYRPIVEIMFADFLTLAMDQLYNHAVKFPGVFPDVSVPLVVRAPSGGRRGYGPTHSQSPENLLTSVPGLTVIYGSHRHQLGELLINATNRWLYPTLFFEHKLLYGETQTPADFEEVPADPRDLAAALFPTVRRGSGPDPDVTLVTYGGMLTMVEQVAAHLESEEELSVEIIAPSLLSPMPKHTLVGALEGRSRVAIVEESHAHFGVSAELLACLMETGFQGRVIRIGTPPVPIPSARSLEQQVIPGVRDLLDEILHLF